MNEFSQATIVGLPQPKTWDDFERGCLATFGGGHHEPETAEAFRHGMQTVFNLLRSEFPAAELCKSAPQLLAACKAALVAIAKRVDERGGAANHWEHEAETQLRAAIAAEEGP